MKELHPNIKITDNELNDISFDSIDNFFNDVKFNFKMINNKERLIKQIDLSKKSKLNQPLQLF